MNTFTARITTGALTATAAVSMVAAGFAGHANAAPSAAARANVSVSIQAEGTDLSGTVNSSRSVCEANRNVVVWKQIGLRGGGDDIRFAMDTSDSNGEWNTGNTGTEGKFYAQVKRTPQCKAATSSTVTAVR